MQKINLKEIKPVPHPTSVVFKKHKIRLSAISTTLGLSYGHVCSILTGIRQATPAVDLKLKDLAEGLEGGGE